MRMTLLRLADAMIGKGLQNPLTASMVLRPWRESATVMLTAPPANETITTPITSTSLPNFLVMTRSNRSSFHPGGLCFPGGVLSDADTSPEWASFFVTNVGEDIYTATFVPPNVDPIPLYRKSIQEGGEFKKTISKEISLRIAAIRETFEECGILLCKPVTREGFQPGLGVNAKKGLGEFANIMELGSQDEVKEWQAIVQSDPDGFEKLCFTYKCYPDVNSLTEWNNWLTPCINTLPKRFDTVFYTALLPKQCSFRIDSQEITKAQWMTAAEVIDGARNEEFIMMPPQIYELERLRECNLKRFERLRKLRTKFGIDRECAVYYRAKNGIVLIMKGDDRYPMGYDETKTEEVRKMDLTLEELNEDSNQNRIVFPKERAKFEVKVNITPKNGQMY